MWDRILEILQDKMVLLCTVLVFLIPFSIHFINRKLHRFADPPWKKEEERK